MSIYNTIIGSNGLKLKVQYDQNIYFSNNIKKKYENTSIMGTLTIKYFLIQKYCFKIIYLFRYPNLSEKNPYLCYLQLITAIGQSETIRLFILYLGIHDNTIFYKNKNLILF